MIDLTIPEPKQAVASSDAASLQHGRELLQRAQKALGGADKIAAVKDSLESIEMVMTMGGVRVKQLTRYVAPSHFRQDQEMPFGKISVYTDGKTGWMATPQGTMPLPDEVLKQAQGEVFRNFFRVILADRDASITVNAVDQNKVEISSARGRSHYARNRRIDRDARERGV